MSGEANAYVAELRAENARLREVVARVQELAEGLAEDFDDGSEWGTWSYPGYAVRERILAVLGSTDTGPAPTGAYAATQGAGDGV